MQHSTKYFISFSSLWISWLFSSLTLSYRFEPNELILENFSECQDEGKFVTHINQTIARIGRNRYNVNGEIEFEEPFPNHLELQVVSEKCDLNVTHCDLFDTFVVRDICKILSLQDQLWSDFMMHTEPKLKCPFKNSPIKIKNAGIDLGYVAHLPLDGHTWLFKIKVFGPAKSARQKRRLLFCISFQITVQKRRSERRKKPKPKPNS